MPDIINEFRGQYKWLSNFAVHPDGKTVEHYYQAAKCVNPSMRKCILELPTAAKAKRAGQICQMDPKWEVLKYKVMYRLLWEKFKIPAFRQLLLETGDAILIEGTTWHDQCWGICTCSKHNGAGKNVLGKMLMLIRRKINEQYR